MIIPECLLDFRFCLIVRELAPHKRAGAALLHELTLAMAGQFGEAVIAIHDRIVDDLRVGQQKCIVWLNRRKKVISDPKPFKTFF